MITVTHDNGNMITFSDGSVYVRAESMYFDEVGAPVPAIGHLIASTMRRTGHDSLNPTGWDTITA